MTRKPATIETSEVRKRLRSVIDQSRRNAAARRARIDAAAEAHKTFLEHVAAPVAHVLANVLLAEGYPFTVFTPNGSVRLASTKSPEDSLEFALDTSQAEPFAVLRVSQSRGRRVVQHERPVKGRTPIEQLTEDDVLQALLEELAAFVER